MHTTENTRCNGQADGTDYRSLMKNRISKILLICNSYDGFTLEEDGRLDSQINEEYSELNIHNPPTVTRVKTTVAALEMLRGQCGFDLVISMMNVGEPDVFGFARMVKEEFADIPVVLLTNYSEQIARRLDLQDRSGIDYIFFWHGSADLILAIVKLIEDMRNADHDILEVGVQAILLVEDNVRYYSTYLPAIYRLILQQSSESASEALNEYRQTLQKRARPKILFATNYNDAVSLYEKYKGNILGVISDVGFVVDKNDRAEDEKPDAGIDFAKLIKKDNPLMPFLMQSSQESLRPVAKELGVGFIAKYSKTLLLQLSDYISRELSFGDFVFKEPVKEREAGRARNLRELQFLVQDIPAAILEYSTSQNHLSKWMFARGLFPLGREFKAKKQSSFGSIEEMRTFIVGRIRDYRITSGQGVIARFSPETYNDTIWYARMGDGSLGGKARGLGFLDNILHKHHFYDRYEGVRVMIPRTVVVTTEYFDYFIRDNGLQYVINSDLTDHEILSEFIASRLPQELLDYLRVYIKTVRGPVAVRSSSKLEDSYYQPFAGVYATYMIPNLDNEDQFLRLLGNAIKSVYASVYYASARSYITATSNVISEEKMAVVIQEVCGTEDDGYFFPTISGVARSENFYPVAGQKAGDGLVKIAVGLGKAVVDGEQVLSFSPRHPRKILQLSSPRMALRETQKAMYALNLIPEKFKTSIDETVNLQRFSIAEASHFRNMEYAASTYDMQNNSIAEMPDAPGPKVITFSHVLKYDSFPLARILNDLLKVSKEEMGTSFEIEFAVNLDTPSGTNKIFNLLQIRPINDEITDVSLDWEKADGKNALLYSESAIGIGEIPDIADIIYVKRGAFDAQYTREIAARISAMNARMKAEGRHYVLVGPGRWGSSDPWLGIPVKWNDISESKIIVECGLEGYNIEPSQGTHFFQNITSFGVGYMTVNPYSGDGVFDEESLDRMEALEETQFVRHVRFSRPLFAFVDGLANKGIVREAGAEERTGGRADEPPLTK